MAMARWDPSRELSRMRTLMERLAGDFAPFETSDVGAWTLETDVIENKDSIIVRAAIPGVRAEDIDVSLEGNVLTINAERREESERKEGRYLMRESVEGVSRRSLRLPNVIDPENAQSNYQNGILTVTFPKTEQAKAKRIDVRGGGVQQQVGPGGEQQAA